MSEAAIRISPLEEVGRIVVAFPRATWILICNRIDYCNRPMIPLVDVCHEKGLCTAELLEEICREPEEGSSLAQWCNHDIPGMVHRLIQKHQDLMYGRFEELFAIFDALAATQTGRQLTVTLEMRDLYELLYRDLRIHMLKEENVVFPYLLSFGNTAGDDSRIAGSSPSSLKSLSMEHEDYVGILFRMLDFSGNHSSPSGDDINLTSLHAGLRSMTEDLMWIIFLENYFLFPHARSE
ncbi:MAG: hemerythrin domain-containing protein [Nitrosomonadales bacterium]|nr:hemerythrin domain-containing protein [Nitrosomonadales bacterium]